MRRLFLLIPSVRPQWVWRCVQYYLCEMEPHDFELRTIIASQNHEPDPKGVKKQNEMIDLLDAHDPSWIMCLADDTIQHPSLFKRLGEVIDANPVARAIVFDQISRYSKDGTGVMRASPQSVRPCHICGGQIAWRRDFIGNHRFNYADYKSRCDGYFAEARFKESPEKFVFVNEPLTYFGSFETQGVPQ